MRVFIIGFMGAGKTAVGKRLSSRLNLPFYDSDACIEVEQKMTVQEIFELKGEQHFRLLEKEWLQNFEAKEAVIALGGGTPCQDGLMDLINVQGTSVYIKPKIGILVSRLMQSKSERPLIAPFKHDKEALMAFVEEKIKEREPYYTKAKFIFESGDMTAEKLDELAALVTSA